MAKQKTQEFFAEVIGGPNKWDLLIEGLEHGEALVFKIIKNWAGNKSEDVKFKICGLYTAYPMKGNFEYLICGKVYLERDSSIRSFPVKDFHPDHPFFQVICFWLDYDVQIRKGFCRFEVRDQHSGSLRINEFFKIPTPGAQERMKGKWDK